MTMPSANELKWINLLSVLNCNFSVGIELNPLCKEIHIVDAFKIWILGKKLLNFFVAVGKNLEASAVYNRNTAVAVLRCRNDIDNLAVTNLYGNAVTKNYNIKAVGILITFALNRDCVPLCIGFLNRLIFENIKAWRVVEKLRVTKNSSKISPLASSEPSTNDAFFASSAFSSTESTTPQADVIFDTRSIKISSPSVLCFEKRSTAIG